jgi:hypothetical protein
VDEYLDAGITTVWLICPRTRTARWCTKKGWFKVPILARTATGSGPIPYFELGDTRLFIRLVTAWPDKLPCRDLE